MQLDIAFYWSDLPNQDLRRTAIVVADVLRATTVMVTALANGAQVIIPQDCDEEARRRYTELHQQGVPVLLSGEKKGFKREGYDLGNSPAEFSPGRVAGKTIVHLTTNGTRALVAASKAPKIWIVSFANLSAMAQRLQSLDDDIERIIGVASGREGRYCLEDPVCLGGMLSALLDPPGRNYEITDAARTAIDLFHVYQDRLLEMARLSYHGHYLEEIGLGCDLPDCVAMDTTDITPEMREGQIKNNFTKN